MTLSGSRTDDALSDGDRTLVEQRLEEFRRAWQPDLLEQWTSTLPLPPSPARLALLLVLAVYDLGRQWSAARRLKVEDYLARYPELGSLESAQVDLLRAELEARSL